MTGNTHAKPAIRRAPPPPTDAERAAAAQWRAQQARSGGDGGVVALVLLGVLALGGAVAAYLGAVHSVDIDNPFMSGDQSHAANYAPAIVLAVAGAFLLLVAAVIGSARSR